MHTERDDREEEDEEEDNEDDDAEDYEVEEAELEPSAPEQKAAGTLEILVLLPASFQIYQVCPKMTL